MKYISEELSKLDGNDWSYLLRKRPQLAYQCDWSKLDGWDWSYLLREQPQLADQCDWSKLDGYDWSYLLREQPQLADQCTTYVLENGCGQYNRTIYISREEPLIIHIGCFSGTREEALSAIKAKYSDSKEYCAKVESCFNKL